MIADISNKYLKLSKYAIDAHDFALQLETHPDYPSLKAISDTFDYFNVDNVTAKVPKEALGQLPAFFLSLLRIGDVLQISLIEKKNGAVYSTNEKFERKKYSVDEFNHLWTGIIVGIEANTQKRNADFSFYENITIAGISLTGLICLAIGKDFWALGYGLLSVLGMVISYFIVKESFGIHNSIVTKVCESISKTNGCSSVLNDKSSQLFGSISLGDIALVYFTAATVSLATIGFDYTFLFCCSALSLPVVMYALYSQGFILKQWCALCLGISTVLVLQFSILTSYNGLFQWDWIFGLKYIFILFFIASAAYAIKRAWTKNDKLSAVQSDFLRFKRNKEIFDLMLSKKRLVNPNLISDKHSISFGSDDPKIIINAVTNPLCGFCAESFGVYYKLLKTHNEAIQVNFIFNVPIEHIENAAARISISVINIYLNESKSKALESLREWYDDRQKDQWESKYKPPEIADAGIMDALKAQQNWVKLNQIDHTPATIINGQVFPKAYDITDLPLFIDDIINEKTLIHAV